MAPKDSNRRLHALMIGVTRDSQYRQLVRLGLPSAGLVVEELDFNRPRRMRTAGDVIVVAARKPADAAVAIRSLRAEVALPIVVIAPAAHLVDFAAAMTAGASGYLLEGMEPASLGRALACAVQGEIVVPRQVVALVTEQVRADNGFGTAEPGGGLTRRERQVLDLLREGLPTRVIAERLSVAPVTVRSHIVSIVRKLEVTDRAALARTQPDDSSGRRERSDEPEPSRLRPAHAGPQER